MIAFENIVGFVSRHVYAQVALVFLSVIWFFLWLHTISDILNKHTRDHNGATEWCVRVKATLAESVNNSEARLVLEHQYRDECARWENP